MTLVGVLAVQGAFSLHERALQACGVETVQVRRAEQLGSVDAVVLPGGESTVMSKLLFANNLFDPLQESIDGGMPVLGTCAGMILLAQRILDGTPDQRSFGAIDIDVRRNFYGRQVDSFEASIELGVPSSAGVAADDSPLQAVFIRAPAVDRVGEGVEVWASHQQKPVLCREGNVVVASFHPELLDNDVRVHQLFLDVVHGA